MTYKLIPADSATLRLEIIKLLQQNELPVRDLDESKKLFALIGKDDKLAGCGGLEVFANAALIRSVCVRNDLRGQHLGQKISRELESVARLQGVEYLFLLTTTAREFFLKENYSLIDRNSVPLSIKETSEFTGLCPSSAIVMRKQLDQA